MMRILTLFLALFLTLLPESVPYVNTSFGQDVCLEEVIDTQEEAIVRSPQRMTKEVRVSSYTELTDRKPGFIPVFGYRSTLFCFERLWLIACMLRL